ncbi:MAG: UTP--glucose-1-phosphate uridylyltransferase [Alphaproteobacteria bacterium]|nr:UTP--glucose-1-phosphate uridylyltransferase [Alphaproteobacteria bacterium]
MPPPVRKAVFPVAGLGTRFLPATKAVPKEMLPVVDKPLIQYALEEAQAAGIEEFIFVTGPGKEAIEAHFRPDPELNRTLEIQGKTRALQAVTGYLPSPERLKFTLQTEPLGLGHAVWCARELVGDEPFAVLLPDDLVLGNTPCLKQLLDVHAAKGGNIVAVMEVPREQTRRYGVLEIGKDDGRLAEVQGLVEKPEPEKAPSTLSIIGRYVLEPAVFDHLSEQQRGAGNEIQLTDAMAQTIGKTPFHGLRFEGRRFDCGDCLGFLEANIAYTLARKEFHESTWAMLEGYAKRD